MSNSVVPAAAAAHAKQLVRNKKLVKRTDDQKPAQDEQQATEKDDDTAHAIKVQQPEHLQASMSDTTMSGDFSFSGALSAAAGESASLAAEGAEQDDDGGSMGDDGDGAGGTVLLVAAVAAVGGGIAVAAGGGGNNNEAPTITSGGTATVAENAAATTVVYTTAASDPDGDPLTYSLTGTDAAAFNISSTGVVTLKAPADFETKSSYSINVVASDGTLTATQAVVVTVTDVAEAPVITSAGTASIAENSPTATVVYDANVAGAQATTFALAGADAAAFTIDSATGEVRFVASPDFEAKSSYDISVTATNAIGSTTKAVAVSVTDVNEAPVAGANNVTEVFTAQDVNANFTLVYTDPEGGDVAYSVEDGDGPANGEVTVGDDGAFTYDPDDGFTGEDTFTVTIQDPEGTTTTQDVTVTVGVGAAQITIDGPGDNLDDDNVDTTYTVVLGNYEYTISGLDAGGDNIIGPAGVAPSVINNNFNDGEVILQYAANNQIALITVDGLTPAQDAQIFGVNSFNNVFGAGTIA